MECVVRSERYERTDILIASSDKIFRVGRENHRWHQNKKKSTYQTIDQATSSTIWTLCHSPEDMFEVIYFGNKRKRFLTFPKRKSFPSWILIVLSNLTICPLRNYFGKEKNHSAENVALERHFFPIPTDDVGFCCF